MVSSSLSIAGSVGDVSVNYQGLYVGAGGSYKSYDGILCMSV